MPSAEVLTIGTELLLGEILDTNAQHIALTLREIGIDLYWQGTVGDNVGRIEQAVRLALGRSEIVLITGGLGPTVDDMTREGVARALGGQLVFWPELWAEIQAYFTSRGRTPSENNRRQAFLPGGAQPIRNPVGTAPGFVVQAGERVAYALPGVPGEMKHLLEHAVVPDLRNRFGLRDVIVVRILNTRGVGESVIDLRIGDLETWSNPTVGLAARPGEVDIRLTAKADTPEAAAELLDALETEIRSRLGDSVSGVDGVGDASG